MSVIKQPVNYSNTSNIISVVSLLMLSALLVFYARKDEIVLLYFLSACMIIWCFVAFYYAPRAISVDDEALCVHRSISVKKILLSEIISIRLCPPTMAEKRLLGSGGFFGYWGWFSEKDLGRYFAYYGKSSDCFLVTLKDGRRYMLGCEHPAEIVDFVRKNIGQNVA